jgi:hypothetical protein
MDRTMTTLWIGTYANGYAYGQPATWRSTMLSFGPYLQASPVRIGTYATQRIDHGSHRDAHGTPRYAGDRYEITGDQ